MGKTNSQATKSNKVLCRNSEDFCFSGVEGEKTTSKPKSEIIRLLNNIISFEFLRGFGVLGPSTF